MSDLLLYSPIKISKNPNLLKQLKDETSFLFDYYQNPTTPQMLWHLKNNDLTIYKCQYCDKNKKWNGGKKPYLDHCGDRICQSSNLKKVMKNIASTPEWKEKVSKGTIKAVFEKFGVENYSQTQEWVDKTTKTNREKFGSDWQFQSENFKEKSTETWIENHGVDHPMKSEDVRQKCRYTKKELYDDENYNNPEKSKETCLERYGVESYTQTEEFKERSKSSCLERYGAESYSQTEEFKERSKATCLERYGVEYNTQNSEIREKQLKNSYKTKEYILPSGNKVYLQGYEPQVLDLLLKNYKEDDIIINDTNIEKEIGILWYLGNDDKKHRYYPDFYIKSENKIIEVKSKYTYNADLNKNLLKGESVKDLGFNFEFIILD